MLLLLYDTNGTCNNKTYNVHNIQFNIKTSKRFNAPDIRLCETRAWGYKRRKWNSVTARESGCICEGVFWGITKGKSPASITTLSVLQDNKHHMALHRICIIPHRITSHQKSTSNNQWYVRNGSLVQFSQLPQINYKGILIKERNERRYDHNTIHSSKHKLLSHSLFSSQTPSTAAPTLLAPQHWAVASIHDRRPIELSWQKIGSAHGASCYSSAVPPRRFGLAAQQKWTSLWQRTHAVRYNTDC